MDLRREILVTLATPEVEVVTLRNDEDGLYYTTVHDTTDEGKLKADGKQRKAKTVQEALTQHEEEVNSARDKMRQKRPEVLSRMLRWPGGARSHKRR